MALDRTTQSTPSDVISPLIASLNALSTMHNATYCRVCLSKSHKTSQCIYIPEDKRKIFMRFLNSNFKQLPTRADPANDQSSRGGFRDRNRSFRGSTSQEAKVSTLAPRNTTCTQQPALEEPKNEVRGPCQAPLTIESLTGRHRH